MKFLSFSSSSFSNEFYLRNPNRSTMTGWHLLIVLLQQSFSPQTEREKTTKTKKSRNPISRHCHFYQLSAPPLQSLMPMSQFYVSGNSRWFVFEEKKIDTEVIGKGSLECFRTVVDDVVVTLETFFLGYVLSLKCLFQTLSII